MKKFSRFSLLAAVVATLSTLSVSAIAATATGTANANVLTPIAITAGAALNFGTFAGNAGTGGTVVVTTAGTRTATGSVVLATGAPAAGIFTVTGSTGATFGVTYPAAFTVTNGTVTMPVTVSGATIGTVAAGGTTLAVGGTITVAANQASGAYTGSYVMTVEYN